MAPQELQQELEQLATEEDQLFGSLVPDGGPYSVAVLNGAIEAWNQAAPALGLVGDYPPVEAEGRGATVADLPAEFVRGLTLMGDALDQAAGAGVIDADLRLGAPTSWNDDNALAMVGGALKRVAGDRELARWLNEREPEEETPDEETPEEDAGPDEAALDQALGLTVEQ